MRTAEFSAALQELLRYAERGATAVMCAEAVSWRCHRALLADALVVRGFTVLHIQGDAGLAERHQLCDFARTDGQTITYAEDTPVPGRVRGNQPRLKTV
jgi:uncharacterized protein (DUF488 family)